MMWFAAKQLRAHVSYACEHTRAVTSEHELLLNLCGLNILFVLYPRAKTAGGTTPRRG